MSLRNKYYKIAKLDRNFSLTRIYDSDDSCENDHLVHKGNFCNDDFPLPDNNSNQIHDEHSVEAKFVDVDSNISSESLLSINDRAGLRENNQEFNSAPQLTPESLKEWAIKHNVNHSALNDLLKLIKPVHAEFPLDARTLLQTPRKIRTKILEPGHYYHFGLEKAVQSLLKQYHSAGNSLDRVDVNINVDGLPLTKSSSSQVYPILCTLVENRNVVEIIGIYQGLEKPKCSNDFLREFVSEAVDLINNGISFENSKYQFFIKSFICDVPAKSFILCTKGHSGYYSCSKCDIEGSYLNGRVCFPDFNFTLRTDYGFRRKDQEEHHIGTTILENIPHLNMVNSFALDPMHLLYLGVVKKIITLWCSGKPPSRLSFNQIQKISASLISLRSDVPCEFNRKPRSLAEYKRWKATEFRTFVLYTGIIVLQSTLNKDLYLHFVTLHVCLTILSNSKFHSYIDYADSLFKYFVKTFGILYGKDNISHNVHNLLHLCNDVKYFGPLEQFSAFPFENYMQTILKHIRKSEKPLEQIILRKFEENNTLNENTFKDLVFPNLIKEHFNGPVLDLSDNLSQFEIAQFINFKLKIIDGPDNCCCLKDGSVVIIQNFVIKDNVQYIIGRKFEHSSDFYLHPCPSSSLGIFAVTITDLAASLCQWRVDDIAVKCIKLKYEPEKYVILPILHTC